MTRKKSARQEQKEARAKIVNGLLGDHFPEDFHDYGLDKHSFTIYVGGHKNAYTDSDVEPGVEHNMADSLERNLHTLREIDSTRPILIMMATCGGYVVEGMQMFGAIYDSPNPTTVIALKDARSMSSIFPLAADRFLIRPTAQFMIHRGSSAFEGLDQEAETDDIQRRKAREQMMRIYIARLQMQGIHQKMPSDKIRDLLERRFQSEIDVWLTAYEAKQWGFVDDVFNGNHAIARATEKNTKWRRVVASVLRKPMQVEVKIT